MASLLLRLFTFLISRIVENAEGIIYLWQSFIRAQHPPTGDSGQMVSFALSPP